jgi:hypothetical protein
MDSIEVMRSKVSKMARERAKVNEADNKLGVVRVSGEINSQKIRRGSFKHREMNEKSCDDEVNDEVNSSSFKKNQLDEDQLNSSSSKKKVHVDWASEYGLSHLPSHKITGGFTLTFHCYEDQIAVSIFRTPSYPYPREDGLDAINLMFSGKISISRIENSSIWNWRSLVNSISMHHPNHFGPQRGLVISDMIQLLSNELIYLESMLYSHYIKGGRNKY